MTDVLPAGINALLYAVVALSALGLLAVWATTRGAERNAGFATRRELRTHLSARAARRARHEIRPGLKDPK